MARYYVVIDLPDEADPDDPREVARSIERTAPPGTVAIVFERLSALIRGEPTPARLPEGVH